MDEEERDYTESEDEDFDPTAAVAEEENVSSSSDEEDALAPARKQVKPSAKRKAPDAEELDSGDEATIQERERKKRKSVDGDEDSGGEGGLVKTRAQRRADKEERREHQRSGRGQVTIDADALWAKLNSAPVGRPATPPLEASTSTEQIRTELEPLSVVQHRDDTGSKQEDLVTITNEYDFAGETVTGEKQVHKDSLEAKLLQQRQSERSRLGATAEGLAIRRPLKRASKFEPNPTGEVKGVPISKQRLRTPSRADVLAQQERTQEEARTSGSKVQRLNTVQKSKMDWATHVDTEGLKDELDQYGRSKQGYLDKMDFLQNVQGKRDLEERQARLQRA